MKFKYGNLNPFAVLMVSYDSDDNTVRKSFRKLSILTHPDKNPDQKVFKNYFICFSNFEQELAQRAFDAVKAAYETLSDGEKKATCLNVVENARKDLGNGFSKSVF